MPFRSARSHFENMLESMDWIEEYVRGISFDIYLRLREKQSAVERELQILTEAAHRLGAEAEVLCPGQDWRDIRGLGNALRHAYDSIDGAVIWRIIHDNLPPLKSAVQEALSRLPQEKD